MKCDSLALALALYNTPSAPPADLITEIAEEASIVAAAFEKRERVALAHTMPVRLSPMDVDGFAPRYAVNALRHRASNYDAACRALVYAEAVAVFRNRVLEAIASAYPALAAEAKRQRSTTRDLPDVVYHFTDTARLPWILASGDLRGMESTTGGNYPSPDFLWATTDARGSRTAAGAFARDAYQSGKLWQIRFTLNAADFFEWSAAPFRNAAWTARHVEMLESAARGENPADWRCRIAPLPLSRVRGIQVKSWTRPGWRDCTPALVETGVVEIDGRRFASKRTRTPSGAFILNIVP